MGPATDAQYDAIVVGARCAGATVAILLARAGRRVLLVDRDEFPSDTVSTHQLFPDSLHLLDELGVGRRLRETHRLRPVEYSWRVLGHAVAGGFTPVGGHDRTSSIRRVTLDAAMVQTATDAGADVRFGTAVDRPGRFRHRRTTRCVGSSSRPASASWRPGSSARTAARRPSPGGWGLPRTQRAAGRGVDALRVLGGPARLGHGATSTCSRTSA